jgi:hypothetical protein
VHQIALAIRDAELFLLATVVRAAATDVYVNWPRYHVVGWKPHTSYDASGQHHQKSFGKAFDARKKQKPDPAFKGTVNLVSFGVATGEHTAVNVRCDPKDFIAVFEVPLAMVRSEKYRTYMYVDLVEPGVDPVLFPDAIILKQESYKGAEPWIVLTFLEIALPREGLGCGPTTRSTGPLARIRSQRPVNVRVREQRNRRSRHYG